jgi:hypothetical protein
MKPHSITFFVRCGVILSIVWLFQSCATYYQKNLKFNNYFVQGNLKEADELLSKDKKATKRKDHLIYYMNRGTLASMLGNYEQSNTFFEEAYRIADSYHTNMLNEGAAFLLNPNITEYKGEDFELLFIHYYKALNYLKMGDRQEALVECKRMNIRLNIVNDKYKSDNRYRRDAFIHVLMGIIYEANEDFNNAYIAYRNAVEIYQQDYSKLFGMQVPRQLINDLLRTAYILGFNEDLALYEREFKTRYEHKKARGSEVVFFWHNGLGPVKSEWSINFSIVRGAGGYVTFVNDELGLSIPFPMPDKEYNESGLNRLEFIRIAFPKYVERPLVYNSGTVQAGGTKYTLETAEDINAIGIRSLKDRMLLELGKGLLRMALKKAAEYAVRNENKDVGALVGVFNALTEQADTRQWQTLPHSIYYCRVPMEPGKQQITFTPHAAQGSEEKSFTFDFNLNKGETYFQTFSSLEVMPGPVH